MRARVDWASPAPPTRSVRSAAGNGKRRRGFPLVVGVWIGLVMLPMVVLAADAPVINVERSDGGAVTGTLVRLESDGLSLRVVGADNRIPAADIRVIERQGTPGRIVGGVRLFLVDGGWIDGDDLVWDGAAVVLSRPDGRVELPVAKLRSVAWVKAGGGEARGPAATWLGALPEKVESDLLVVGSGERHEFVECAIKGVTADAVTVVLDDETIPVKRSKVIGIHWLRPEATGPGRGAVAIDIVGGTLRAKGVEWTPESLLLDGDVRIPGSAVERLDWAAGRTVSLAALAPERLEVEPWFGALGKVPGLEGYFAPRALAAGEGFARPGLVIRPRTVVVWRLPAEARRLRTALAPAAGAGATGTNLVSVAIDDREVFRGEVGAASPTAESPEGIPVDIDLAGGRRLTVTVDFGSAADPGGPVRLSNPVIEQ